MSKFNKALTRIQKTLAPRGPDTLNRAGGLAYQALAQELLNGDQAKSVKSLNPNAQAQGEALPASVETLLEIGTWRQDATQDRTR